MIAASRTTGVLLAGGKSSRMGCDKGFLEIFGETFAQRLVNLLRRHFPEVLISANDAKAYQGLNLPVIEDEMSDAGPLSGILSALSFATNAHALFVPVDMPLIGDKVIEKILEEGVENFISVVSDGESLFPLLGIYPKALEGSLRDFLKAGKRKVHDFLFSSSPDFKVIVLKEHRDELRSINTPEDYKLIRSYEHR